MPNTMPTRPDIFDRDLLAVRRGRAARRPGGSFLVERALQDAAERLLDVNRRFKRAMIIGPSGCAERLAQALPGDKCPETLVSAYFCSESRGLDMVFDEEQVPPFDEPFDLIISILSLHSLNDLPGTLIQLRRQMRPDGFFMGCMFGGDTLAELRQAAYQVDAEMFGGVSPRVLPFADYSQAASLLQRAGFNLPVVDTDRVRVNYATLSKLIFDIRDLGDGNCLSARSSRYLGRAYYRQLEQTYSDMFGTEAGKLKAQFEILWMSGWVPHESQQKPLKPGSAKVSLKDAVGRASS